MGGSEQKFVNEAFSTNWIAPLGPNVDGFENDLKSYLGGAKHVAALSSGTAAIHMALQLLDVSKGDEVLCQSFTFSASANPIIYQGATPVFIDSESDTWNMSPELLEIAIQDRIEKYKKPKAIIAVHLYGNAVDLDSVLSFCKANKIFLIEDVSQAHGAKYKGKRLGSIGDIGCFSCYPTKNLGAIGDAGLITTNNLNLANKARMIREYGWHNRTSMFPGRNSRLDELQAAILRIKLKYLDSDNQKRRGTAKFYYDNLSLLPIFYN